MITQQEPYTSCFSAYLQEFSIKERFTEIRYYNTDTTSIFGNIIFKSLVNFVPKKSFLLCSVEMSILCPLRHNFESL